MIFEYTCPRCNNKFTSPLNANSDQVNCPYCSMMVAVANISLVIDNPTNNDNPHPSVQAHPIQARPVKARPIQARPIQAQPAQAQPVQVQPVQVQPVQPQPQQEQNIQPIQPILPIQSEQVNSLSKEESDNSIISDKEKTDALEQDQILSESDKKLDDALLKKSLAVMEEQEPMDVNSVEVAEELQGAFDEEDMSEPATASKKKLYIGLLGVIVIAACVIFYFVFSSNDNSAKIADRVTNGHEMESIEVDSLKAFSKNHPEMGIKEYFKIDIDQDGVNEVFANKNDHMIAYGVDNGKVSMIYNEPVLEWVWLRGKGLFIVSGNEKQTEGKAIWLKKSGGEMVEDLTQENYEFANGKYFKLQNGKNTKISADDYYGFVNMIIKNYTKLNAIKLN